jgi:15-cis-phytoene synthase
MGPELIASYQSADAVARNSGSSFYYSFLVLPPEKKRAFCAVYAFMRYCDDISDGADSVDAKCAQLGQWRSQLDAVFSGALDGNAIFPAFLDTARRYSIPADYFHWVIDGAEMDLTVARYETFQELYKYCFNVASAVGLVCLKIFGFTDEAALKHAEECGIAFQLTNILRDIQEDAERGRIYLPLEDLRRFQYTEEELRAGLINDRFRDLMEFETQRARSYYASARKLIPLVEPASRPALWAMIQIYERILDRIVSKGFDVFRSPIHLAATEKVAIALRAMVLRFIPGSALR